MSQVNSDEEPIDEIPVPVGDAATDSTAWLSYLTKADPLVCSLYHGMATGWRIYYLLQTRLIAHLAETRPGLSEQLRADIAKKAVGVAVLAAQRKPATAGELEDAFTENCGPLLAQLRELDEAAEEDEETE